MQRIMTLGLLASLVGGGATYLQTLAPKQVREAVHQFGGQVSQRFSQSGGRSAAQQSSFAGPIPQGYGDQSGYTPYGDPAARQQPAGFSPPPAPTHLPTIRIASFNIQTLGDSKAKKPHVMQAIGQIVRQFDVIAIQEIRTQDDYYIPKLLRDYVNVNGVEYDALVSPRLGRTVSTEQYAFLYNTAKIETAPGYSFVAPDPNDLLHREPHIALFRTRIDPRDRAFTFALINSHTDPDEVEDELNALYSVYREVQRMPVGGAYEDDIILLGDLNTAVPSSSPYRTNSKARQIVPSDLHRLAEVSGLAPLIRNQATNTVGSKLHDNLLIPTVATTEFTGSAGVVDVQKMFGINTDQAKQLSDHLPVWGEFSAVESTSLGSVARRP